MKNLAVRIVDGKVFLLLFLRHVLSGDSCKRLNLRRIRVFAKNLGLYEELAEETASKPKEELGFRTESERKRDFPKFRQFFHPAA